MQVKDAMTSHIVGIQEDAPIAEAIELMLKSHISGLLVFDATQKLVGILSEGDLLRRVELGTEEEHARWVSFLRGPGKAASDYVRSHGRRVSELMSTTLFTADKDDDLYDAVGLMNKHRVKRLPVTSQGEVVGIVTRADLLRLLASLLPATDHIDADDSLREAICRQIAAQDWAPITTIDVEVHGGNVDLHGNILDERQREALIVIAENTPGVKAVHDHLVWIEPYSGAFLLSAEDQKTTKNSKSAA
ncbi:CBS domain-containing protein [Methylovirgula sp. 4M-Z18]|uniref:CBS domain-containing protein n=1 Tax=Methylovirgula sp. 4M-Z18 TaxID=2293567 RepID=UPI000E2F1EB2|nr:CBS domain-containing protein [Methylovirgula sp. 4M-Z18]RFB76489.1 CBS domain-containing protein [Methylovirgula sp. 4M-Z18]